MSCKLVDKQGKLQPNAGELPTIQPVLMWLTGFDDLVRSVASYQERDVNKFYGTRDFGWVSGTAMLISDSVIKKTGVLDEKIFMYAEDVDYCWRAHKAGFKVGWTDNCSLYHLGGGSSENPKYKQWLGEFRGLLYLYNKYYGLIAMIGLRILMYVFIALRSLAFLVLGKVSYAKAYAKILINL
jgi:GT2 family glycosyltransferase